MGLLSQWLLICVVFDDKNTRRKAVLVDYSRQKRYLAK